MATDDEELRIIASEQRGELMASRFVDSDLEFAYRLQLQEAINASLAVQPSCSTSPPSPPLENGDFAAENHGLSSFADLQTVELENFEREINDRALFEAETRKSRVDLDRRIHDQKLAREISMIPEDEWIEYGDNVERPYGEGSSFSSKSEESDEVFRVFFKGLSSEELGDTNRLETVTLAGIGVAVCDSRDGLIFELRKPVEGAGKINRRCLESMALIEALNVALALGLTRVVLLLDYFTLYQFVIGRWMPRQQNVASLLNQVDILRKKFTYCAPSLVARNDVKFAFKLAREAIVSQIKKPERSSSDELESCVICLEAAEANQFFSINGCMHRFCFSCMKQHVEVKLLYGMVPKCPHEGCSTDLNVATCEKFLTPKLLEMMSQRIKEASIPVTQKIYCPYPKCSALMSKAEILQNSNTSAFPRADQLQECLECHRFFCIDCKVPWHVDMTCYEYKRRNPTPLAEVAKLKNLAARNLWKECAKCNHMIELAAGCYHITCRCGYEFCYTCGAEWKNKKATCACLLWDEENILYDDEEEEHEEDGGCRGYAIYQI